MPTDTQLERLLLRDKDVARLLSFSPSWVRTQRFRRKHGLPHTLDIGPIYVGTAPCYRPTDIEAWLERQVERARDGEQQGCAENTVPLSSNADDRSAIGTRGEENHGSRRSRPTRKPCDSGSVAALLDQRRELIRNCHYTGEVPAADRLICGRPTVPGSPFCTEHQPPQGEALETVR